MTSDFEGKLKTVRDNIAKACARAGRDPADVGIIAVTKTHGPEVVRDAWEHGLSIMGENRVQEAAAKIPESVAGPEWHLIGHLQKNKIRPALELFSFIHSVDSLEILNRIDRIADEIGAKPHILLEVNVSGESSKFGLKPDCVPEVIARALECRSLTLEGFMTMAPISPNPEDTRPVFRRLRECRDKWEAEFDASFPRLSMGMSGDYEIAVEEGATWVRIGTALFGDRPKWKPVSEECEEKTFVVD